MKNHTPVFINLLAIARYDHTPDYPIQFMTIGNLSYSNPEEALLQYYKIRHFTITARRKDYHGAERGIFQHDGFREGTAV